MFLASLRVHRLKISTAKEKIAQIYLRYLHVFPSLLVASAERMTFPDMWCVSQLYFPIIFPNHIAFLVSAVSAGEVTFPDM